MPNKVLMRHSVAKMQTKDESGRTVVEANLYDEIVGSDVWSNYFASEGWAANAKSFEQSLLSAIGDQDLSTIALVTKIKSYGGVVDEGVAMFNILRNYSGKVALLKTQCIASAASSASIVFLAGDEREVCLGAEVMIHNSSYGWIPFAVDAKALESLAAGLHRTDKRIANMYVERTGIALDEVVAMMDAETYLDAGMALEKGFATAKSSEKALASVGDANLMKMSAGVRNVSAGIQFAGITEAPPVTGNLSAKARIALGAMGAMGLSQEDLGGADIKALQAQVAQANEKLEAVTLQAMAFQGAALAAKELSESLQAQLAEIDSKHQADLQEKDSAHVLVLQAKESAHATAIEELASKHAAAIKAKDEATKQAVDTAVRAFALDHHINHSPEMPPPESNSGHVVGAAQTFAQQASKLLHRN